MTPWAIPEEDDPDFPGKIKALYQVKILFHDNTGTHAFSIMQDIAIFADQVGDYWYLLGMRPYPQYSNKTVENASYHGIIYLYREVSE